MRVILLVLLAALVSLGFSQGVPPVGGGSWSISLAKSDTAENVIVYWDAGAQSVKELSYGENQPPSSVTFDPIPVNYTKTVKYEGEATFTLTWTGQGAPPQSIVVRLDASAFWKGSSGSGTSGLDFETPGASDDAITIDGHGYKVLAVTNGQATVTISGAAETTLQYEPTYGGYGASGYAWWDASCTVISQGIGVLGSPVSTYYRFVDANNQVLRRLNTPDLENVWPMTIGANISGERPSPYVGVATAPLGVTLLGDWLLPVTYAWSGVFQTYPAQAWTHTYQFTFSESELVGMMAGPRLETRTVTAKETYPRSGFTMPSHQGKGSISIHAPLQILGSERTEALITDLPARYPPGHPNEGNIVLLTSGPNQVGTVQIGEQVEITITSPTISSGFELSGSLKKLLEIKWPFTVSWQTSPNSTTVTSVAQTVSVGPTDTLQNYHLINRSRIEQDLITMARYDSDGYSSDTWLVLPDPLSRSSGFYARLVY